MFTDTIIYATLALSSFINILVPISGSSTITPFLAILTDPHRAIGLASFYFILSGIIRIFLFRKDIQWVEVKTLIVPSLVAGVIGASTLIVINTRLLLWVVLGFAIYFLFKKVGFIATNKNKEKTLVTSSIVGLLSGFFQGTGLAGSDIRNSYLYSKDLSITQLHGTTALIGTSIFSVATVIRLVTNQLTIPDLLPLVYIFPVIVVGTLIGRHMLYKINKKLTNIIIILVMSTIIVFLVLKIFNI